MVNLEVWIPPENNTAPLMDNHIKECGYIAPPGRFGWFIPVELISHLRLILDKRWSPEAQDLHWTAFRDIRVSAVFSVTNKLDMRLIEESSIKNFTTGE